jgi:hypothetical protein
MPDHKLFRLSSGSPAGRHIALQIHIVAILQEDIELARIITASIRTAKSR